MKVKVKRERREYCDEDWYVSLHDNAIRRKKNWDFTLQCLNADKVEWDYICESHQYRADLPCRDCPLYSQCLYSRRLELTTRYAEGEI